MGLVRKDFFTGWMLFLSLKETHFYDQLKFFWTCSVFTQKQVFGPHTAKFQPINGIHVWANLDHDRRMGGSRPNENDYVFVILVTQPKSYIETTDRHDFGGKQMIRVSCCAVIS